MGFDCISRHARKGWSCEFEDFEKESVEGWHWTMESSSWGFGHWIEVLSFFGSRPTENNWDLKHHEMCRALGMVSIVWLRKTFKNFVSLLGLKNRSHEINTTVRSWNDRIRQCFAFVNVFVPLDWYDYCGYTTHLQLQKFDTGPDYGRPDKDL